MMHSYRMKLLANFKDLVVLILVLMDDALVPPFNI